VRRYATDDGFLQVRKNHALVLVGEAVAAEDIDASDAGRRLDEARAALERANDGDGDVHAARREVGFAEALVKTAAG
jgi:F0F1-type ATP synthase epsilon subunit